MGCPKNARVRSDKVFLELARHIERAAAREGVCLTPVADADERNDFRLSYYSRLPEQQRNEINFALEAYSSVCEQVQADGMSARDSKILTWKMLSHMGYASSSDLLNDIRATDLIQVYGATNRLIFASMNFFELTTYSLEDLYCRPWTTLYDRDNAVTEAILNEVRAVFGGNKTASLVPEYLLMETASANPQAGVLKPRWFAPLFEKDKVIGFICANEVCKRLTTKTGVPSPLKC
jgi:hypothetical protein